MKQIICVLFGGCSTEYEISLRSAESVLANLDRTQYEVITVGITKEGKWFWYDGPTDRIAADEWYSPSLRPVAVPLDHSSSLLVMGNDGTYSHIRVDAVFPVLHGKNGEDGTVQGLLELAEIPYVGVGVLASAVGMDKDHAKMVFAHAGIGQANWITLRRQDDQTAMLDEAERKLGYPMFVKPANAGSSIGIGKAKDRNELNQAVANAFEYDQKIIIEEFLCGHEVECAVLGGKGNIIASCVGEVLASQEFYTYDAKYAADSTSVVVIPADLDESVSEQVRENAIKAFAALDGYGLSRVDFFVDGDKVRINEINTMPGFTSISMYPKLFAQSGIPYSELLTRLINLALERNHG
ncbi:MAG: D-alanine--D-alanine ligase [Ruminococcaceae bacterium]|nr:D-alanine--D-alanine ligase [Oscillospiraceae bacterium]